MYFIALHCFTLLYIALLLRHFAHLFARQVTWTGACRRQCQGLRSFEGGTGSSKESWLVRTFRINIQCFIFSKQSCRETSPYKTYTHWIAHAPSKIYDLSYSSLRTFVLRQHAFILPLNPSQTILNQRIILTVEFDTFNLVTWAECRCFSDGHMWSCFGENSESAANFWSCKACGSFTFCYVWRLQRLQRLQRLHIFLLFRLCCAPCVHLSLAVFCLCCRLMWFSDSRMRRHEADWRRVSCDVKRKAAKQAARKCTGYASLHLSALLVLSLAGRYRRAVATGKTTKGRTFPPAPGGSLI